MVTSDAEVPVADKMASNCDIDNSDVVVVEVSDEVVSLDVVVALASEDVVASDVLGPLCLSSFLLEEDSVAAA